MFFQSEKLVEFRRKLNLENFNFSLMSICLFVNVLKITLKFIKRDIKLDTIFVNKIRFQIKEIFDLSR